MWTIQEYHPAEAEALACFELKLSTVMENYFRALRERVVGLTERDGEVWKDDCIDLFIDSAHDRTVYRQFIVSQANVQFDAATRTLSVSKIFEWYEDDFLRYLKATRGLDEPNVADYVRLYLEEPLRTALDAEPSKPLRIEYLSYDKSLNEA